MSKTDLLLVTPSSRQQVYQILSAEYAAVEPPVWSGLIAEFMRQRGYSVKMLDAEALSLTHQETARRIVAEDATLTVFVVYGQQPSASTQCMPAGRAVCLLVNESAPGMQTIVMGTHASALPRRTLLEEPYRYVVEGEGPHTILELLKTIQDGSMKLEGVPGLWYRDQNGAARGNRMAEKIKDLDAELPGQAWDLLDMSLYKAHNWHCFDRIDARQPYASLQTSLGCPYKCTFCCINAPFGGSGIRYWSVENIMGQIDKLVTQYGVRNIKIPDEMFVLNEHHVLGICDGIIERGYDLNIWAYARVDTVKDKFLEKLKKAGFNWLALGIESGSKYVRDGVQKGRFGDTDIEEVVRRIHGAGISICGNYIFGLPDDTHASMRETLDFAKKLSCEWANFYCAMAYPGSQLFKIAEAKGWALPQDWLGFSQHSVESYPLPTETLSVSEVLAFRDQAFIEYFTDPTFLRKLQEKYGLKAVEHVQKMASIRIDRKFSERT